MDEQLQKALADVLDKSVGVVEEGANFLAQEIPDVIQQLLLWKMAESLALCFAALALLVLCVVISRKCGIGEGALVHPEYRRRKITLTHDEGGELSPHIMLSLLVGVLVVGCAIALINLDWLKILLAPKVYLIEYAAKLVN